MASCSFATLSSLNRETVLTHTAHVAGRFLISVVGEVFATTAGSLPVISSLYMTLPIPMTTSLAISGACFLTAFAAFAIGKKLLSVGQENSSKSSSFPLEMIIQYVSYRCLKAFSMSLNIAAAHLLLQQYLMFTPLVLDFSTIGRIFLLGLSLFIDPLVLNTLRLTQSQKIDCGVEKFQLYAWST